MENCVFFSKARSILEHMLWNRNLTQFDILHLLSLDCRAWALKLSEHLKKQQKMFFCLHFANSNFNVIFGTYTGQCWSMYVNDSSAGKIVTIWIKAVIQYINNRVSLYGSWSSSCCLTLPELRKEFGCCYCGVIVKYLCLIWCPSVCKTDS